MLWPLKPLSLAILCFSASCYGKLKDKRQVEPYCSKYRAVAYYTNWAIYARKFTPDDLPVTLLTHVLYAFANINPSTGAVYLSDPWADTSIRFDNETANEADVVLHGCLGQLYLLKGNRNLKVLLSIGGSTYSSNFAGAVSTDSGRAVFASSAISLVKTLGLDGLDINWEYPDDETEATNLVLLLRKIREQLDQYGNSLDPKYHFELTFASPAGPSHYKTLKQSEMDKYLDFWNLMAYDYAGSWSTTTGHQANLFSAGDSSTPFDTKSAVDYYISNGVSSEKIVVGMPLYGRSFVHTTGLGQTFKGTGDGTWEKGVYDFKSLPLDGSDEVYDEELGASYSWDAAKQELISYDTVEVARQKATWIQEMNLGGAMWWESSADKKGRESLVESVVRVLEGCLQQAANNVKFPDSPFVNIRNPPLSQLGSSTASISPISPTSSESKSASKSASELATSCNSEMSSNPDTTSNSASSPTSPSPTSPSPASISLISAISEIGSSTCTCGPATSKLTPTQQASSVTTPTSISKNSENVSTNVDPDTKDVSEQSRTSSAFPSIVYTTTVIPVYTESPTYTTVITVVRASTR